MSDIVIKAENISKLYKLGSIGTGSLRRDLQWWWDTKVFKRDLPYYKLNTGIDFDETNLEDDFEYINYAPEAGTLWALKNVDFEINKGEAWGIIGRNGSGKSTFLKILSRIIKPTSGTVKGKGKVSSLLEVGTGFHLDLSGRENIYISGYMLGMKKAEIQSKFDEIVAFSGIEKFLDTPVKRYSSGMYVRLAFSVAAHLEPDILILDEILSVGDAEFQKKCIAKMKDTLHAKGRTIIYVSHNLPSVTSLCSKAMWLESGKVKLMGDSKHVVNSYLGELQKPVWKQEFLNMAKAPGNEFIKVLSVELVPHFLDHLNHIDIRTEIVVKFKFYNYEDNINLSVDLLLYTLSGDCIFDVPSPQVSSSSGLIEGECIIPGNFLNDGSYYFSLCFVKDTSGELFTFDECLTFEVTDYRENNNWQEKWWGYVRPAFPLKLNPVVSNTAERIVIQ